MLNRPSEKSTVRLSFPASVITNTFPVTAVNGTKTVCRSPLTVAPVIVPLTPRLRFGSLISNWLVAVLDLSVSVSFCPPLAMS